MIHHPPLPGQATPAKALHDAAELAALLEKYGAELVIHGHNHRSMLARVGEHATPVVGVPAASMAVVHHSEPLARYHLYRIARAPDGAWSTRMISRGLREPDGPFEHIDDMMLTPHKP
jgi:3',5'-cyclic AMP phosphodiesterase CpdA